MSATSIVAYVALFAAVGFLFVFAALLLGRLLRGGVATTEKQETYECGEPAIGSSFVQFDLRFYVVALVFIVFEVEVAFFFPWATVFGKATQLMDPHLDPVVEVRSPATPGRNWPGLSRPADLKHREMGISRPKLPKPGSTVQENTELIRAGARKLALAALADIGVFFAVLLVGFAYVWKRGDLDWVRPASWRRARSLQPVQGAAADTREQ